MDFLECGTSLGISLVYYSCTNVPEELEIRVNHAGIEPSVPVGNEAISQFDYKKDCLKEGSFVNRAGVVGSHNGLNCEYSSDAHPLNLCTVSPCHYAFDNFCASPCYSSFTKDGEYWDMGISQGRVVCFFREPKQRLISAFWHANHADGMPRLQWSEMRAKISVIQKNISHYREHKLAMTQADMARKVPPEVVAQYVEAIRIYAMEPGIKGCMTKMILGCSSLHLFLFLYT